MIVLYVVFGALLAMVIAACVAWAGVDLSLIHI